MALKQRSAPWQERHRPQLLLRLRAVPGLLGQTGQGIRRRPRQLAAELACRPAQGAAWAHWAVLRCARLAPAAQS